MTAWRRVRIEQIEAAIFFLIAPMALLASHELVVLFVLWGLIAGIRLRMARLPGAILCNPWLWLWPWLWAVLLLALWGVLSVFWAQNAENSALRAARLLVEVALGASIAVYVTKAASETRQRWLTAAAWGVAFAVLLALVERATDGEISQWLMPRHGVTGTNPGATVMALLFAPVVAHVRAGGRWVLALALAAGVLLSVFLLHSDTAKLALLLAIFAGGVAGVAGGRLLRVMALSFGLLILAAPVLVNRFDTSALLEARADAMKPSMVHRLVIWRWVTGQIEQKWWTGWGLESSRNIPEGRQKTPLPGSGLWVENLPLHPHNAALELWVDLGAPGAILGAAILGGITWRAGRTKARSTAMVRTMVIVAAVVIASSSYGLWQSWWLASLWLTGALAASVAARERHAA